MKKNILFLGDLLAILLITIIGFASHGETGISFLPRMAAVFFPLSISWLVLALGLGLFQPEAVASIRELWRPALGMIFAASLAAILRGLLLHAPILPIFAVVLGITSAIGMLIWRGIYMFLNRRA